MKSTIKIKLTQIEDFEITPDGIDMYTYESPTCWDLGVFNDVSRIVYTGADNNGLCINATESDLGKEVIMTNFSFTSLTVDETSSSIIKHLKKSYLLDSQATNGILLKQVPSRSWMRLRVARVRSGGRTSIGLSIVERGYIEDGLQGTGGIEQGIFYPALIGTVSGDGPTARRELGDQTYTRIGNKVDVWFNINLLRVGGDPGDPIEPPFSGDIRLTDLPYGISIKSAGSYSTAGKPFDNSEFRIVAPIGKDYLEFEKDSESGIIKMNSEDLTSLTPSGFRATIHLSYITDDEVNAEDEEEYPEETIRCDDTVNQQGRQGLYSFSIDMGTATGMAGIWYSMRSIPDEAYIRWNGEEVASTGGLVSGTGELLFNKTSAYPTKIIVTIGAPRPNTRWSAGGICPGTR